MLLNARLSCSRLWSKLCPSRPAAARRALPRAALMPRELQIESLESRTLLTVAGTLDPSFGTGGKTIATITAGDDYPSTMMLQQDGKAVVVGTIPGATGDLATSSNFAVTRFNTDGTLDTTFGTNGTTKISFGAFSNAYGLAIQGDGRIIAVGEAAVSTTSRFDFAIARLNVNGTLDTSWGGSGILTTIVGAGNSRAASVVLQANGEVVVGGTEYNGTRNDFALARYLANGSLDTSFGNRGTLNTGVGSAGNFGIIVRMQADQRIVLAGNYANTGSSGSIAVLRYLSNGSLDTSWNGNGIATASLGSATTVSGVVVQSDGRVVVAATAFLNGFNDFAALRYNTNGALDTTFGGGRGFVTTAFQGSGATAYGLAVDPAYRIVVAGEVNSGGFEQYGLVRYTISGTLDASFGTTGRVTGSVGTGNSLATGVRIQDDGNIVASGPAQNGGNGVDFSILRLTGVQTPTAGDSFTQLRVFRAYNPTSDDHFFTTSLGEFNAVLSHGYTDETTNRPGFSIYAGQVPNSTPLYRLFNPNDGRHYYTLSAGERDSLGRSGWNYEQIAGYMFTSVQSGTTEIYHLYNVLTGSQVFTENATMRDAILSQFPGVWVQQKSLGFAIPTAASATLLQQETLSQEVADTVSSLAKSASTMTPGTTTATVQTSTTPVFGMASDTTSAPGTGTAAGYSTASNPTTSSTTSATPGSSASSSSSHDQDTSVVAADLAHVFATFGWPQ